MPALSISQSARRAILYTGMWFIVIWHSLAMIVAVMPDSALGSLIKPLFKPYVTLFRLDNGWGFFAPDVETGMQLRYVVEDATGAQHTFIPTDKLSRYDQTWIWMTDRFRTVLQTPETHAIPFGELMCREHAELRPRSISIISVEQKRFWPEDWHRGKKPLDPEFTTMRTLKVVACPA